MWLKDYTQQEIQVMKNELLQWESEEYVQIISEEELRKAEREGRGW